MYDGQPDWAVPVLSVTAGGLAPLLEITTLQREPDPRVVPSLAGADLPAPPGIFVGRQRELRVLRTMLESRQTLDQ